MRSLLGYLRSHHLGLIALVLALSGTAYAASQVTSKDIKNKTITAKDVKPKTLTGKQVKDATLDGADLADDSITGADIDESTLNVTRVVARLRDSADHVVPDEDFTRLETLGSWTQRADELDQFAGSFTVNFPAGCDGPRNVLIALTRPNSTFPLGNDRIVAQGIVQSTRSDAETISGSLSGFGVFVAGSDPESFEPGAEVGRTLVTWAAAGCDGVPTATPVLSDVSLDVLGHR